MIRKLLEDRGSWYRGNLHMHTTRSDGALDRDAAIRLYADRGYDFVAVTDHRINGEEESLPDITVLSGSEWDTGDNVHAPVFHILCIGNRRPVAMKTGPRPEVEEILSCIQEAGGIPILAHPSWSLMNPEDIRRCRGIAAAEIFNSVSDLPMNPQRADASLYIDLWAKAGILVPVTAADDTHSYRDEACVSWVEVGAASRLPKDLLAAIRDGNFYATQGPQITALAYDPKARQMTLTTPDDVAAVYVASNLAWSNERIMLPRKDGVYRYRALPGETYLRPVVVGRNGARAFVSPFATA